MTVIQFVVASAAEAELGALFHICQIGIIFLKHPQGYGACTAQNISAL
jgi:hypothetical protein